MFRATVFPAPGRRPGAQQSPRIRFMPMLYFLLALMVLSWSGNFVVAKFTVRELPPPALIVLRIWLSSAVLLIYYYGFRKRGRRKLLPGDWKVIAGLGLIGVGVNQTGFTFGIERTTAAHSSLIVSLSPVFVLLLAAGMKLESITWRKALGVSLCFGGMTVLAADHGLSSDSPTFVGDLFTLGGSFAFALYTVLGKRVSTRYDTLTLTTFAFAAAALGVAPFGCWEMTRLRWGAVGWGAWLGVAYMALVASVLAYMIYYYALTRIEASRVATVTYLQPILATALGIVLLGEEMTPHLAAGGALVVTGVWLAARKSRQTAPVHLQPRTPVS